MLRSVDALARDLPPDEWAPERRRFYRFASRHVLTPMRLLDLNDYLPRLLGLAVACRDWNEAQRIVSRVKAVIENLRSNVEVVPSDASDRQWSGYLRHLKYSLLEAVVRSYPIQASTKSNAAAADRVIEKIHDLNEEDHGPTAVSCDYRTRDLFWSDLARMSFKDSLLDDIPRPTTERSFDVSNLPESQKDSAKVIGEFLQKIASQLPTIVPILFPTRPLNASEVTECLPEASQNLTLLRELVHALRGTWVKPQAPGEDHEPQDDAIEVGIVETKTGEDRDHEPSN